MKIKAIKIDSTARTITEVEIDPDNLDDYYKHIKCECMCLGFELRNKDTCFVDDEGLLKPLDMFFTYKGAHQPFAGNGLLVGSNNLGEAMPVKTSILEVSRNVRFLNVLEARFWRPEN